MIDYKLQLTDPGAHEFAVSMRFPASAGQALELTLPAWIPGSYMIRDFARNLMDLRAESADGRPLPVAKLDKQTWSLTAADAQVRLYYRVYAFDESVRSAYFDNTRAFFNGTSLFLRLKGSEGEPHGLSLQRPDRAPLNDWHVATTLPAESVDRHGFGRYQARDYAQLIDHPMEIGRQRDASFELQGKPHQMSFVDAPSADLERVARDLGPICAEHAAMFGELPVQRYLFITLATAAGYGGLEHRDSTMLVCKRADLPYPGIEGLSKGYRTFLALCSHEYFHLWNVKRIRPQRLAEATLAAETHTELLWAFEGITSYYDELALVRAGTLEAKAYLDMLAPAVTRYSRGHGRTRQSVAQSSFDAWTCFYKQDDNAPNAIVSYYTKGGLIALGLDHLLRTGSQDSLCLDDLMRRLWQRYGATDVGIPERHIEQELADLLGAPVDEFFAAYVYGTEALPLERWFADFGVGMRLRPAGSADDSGGAVEPEASQPTAAASLGWRTGVLDGWVRIEQTLQGGAACAAGLSTGDLLVAIDGERVTAGNLAELLGRRLSGQKFRLDYFRRDRLQQVEIALPEPLADTCDLWLLPEAQLSPEVLHRRRRWLASSVGRDA